MSRLSKLGYSLSSSSSASSSFSSSFSPFKDRRTPTIPCRSLVPDCSPIRSAGVPSFTEVRRGSYLATRSSRASAPAPARSAPFNSAPSTRFVRAPVPARPGTGETLTRSLPSQSRGAAQQDRPLDSHSILERARLRSQALRSRYNLPERPPVDRRTQPRVELASPPSVPTTGYARCSERIRRILAEEARCQAARSADRRATLSKLAAFDEVVARVRARKQSTPSTPSIDATRPVTRSERVRPSAPSVHAARPATRSEQARLSAPSISDRISDIRAARAERRRRIDEMIAQQKAQLASMRATTSALAPAIEQFRAKRQARLANRSREGHPTPPHPAPTNGTRSTAIPATDLLRTQRSTPSADRLRKDKPAKRVRFGDVTVQPVSRWIVPKVGRPSSDIIEADKLTGIIGHPAWRVPFSGVMTHPRTREVSRSPSARSAKGGAPPRRADAETDETATVYPPEGYGGAKAWSWGGWRATFERLYCNRIRFEIRLKRQRPPANREELPDGAGGWWLVLLVYMRVKSFVVYRKLDVRVYANGYCK
ncbi:uncharacterized protein CDV56_109413 [Aspergillus thermomutatus]|uniref:Uncharacterized protein n=1 Tax=Aspergillus thermomutatus TaxID=41047 RepID=A0A397I3X9_ASPTH|nr:uncharacterized protein CDV56_109413 [Aspergillus thermomutatus]RHZ67953.1 hypothetical protein CDV56_109413 [Aspergillus thermomutatus]